MKLTQAVDELRSNPEQWQAFATDGHVVVHAPPGSGKTKLLATRVAFDLVNKIPPPHGAACVTLTNAAAEELRARIEAIGSSRRPTLFIGTVHSFAYTKIILPFAELTGRAELTHRSVATKAETQSAMKAAIASTPSAGDDRYLDSTINVLRNRFATDEQWAAAGDVVFDVAQRYLNNLASANLIDFTGIIEAAVEIVEKSRTVRKVLNAKYPSIYVDEYQDLAPGLDRLVKALCFDYFTESDLFAVGDPDQAVFGFNGAKPELLHDLSCRQGVTPIQLKSNYRSGHEILRVAKSMKHSEYEVVGRRVGGRVRATFCPGGSAGQSVQAADYIQELQQQGVSLNEIVVICPDNRFCGVAAIALRQRQLPVFFRNSQEYGLSTLTSFVERCVVWSSLACDEDEYRLADLQRRWRSLLGNHWDWSRAVELTRVLLEIRRHLDDPASSAIESLRDAGLDIASKRPQFAGDAPDAEAMHLAVTTGALKDFSTRAFAQRVRKSDCVEVTTMTSSKGLEFDHVVILGMNQNLVPHFNAIGNPEKMAEERRKFYVSLTRARESIEVYYSDQINWTKSTSRAEPSIFLDEAGLLEARSTQPFFRPGFN
ncbi:ATP-dependent helicase [Nocardia cyriacigeorgica]|uniref:ATP-dependent helicase n=1 Tax=Nocardia cyriacigeorgica TaxID=135487 RepID=UPI0013D55D17|nr:ATP-dependent helicase [Nocardia cyriacigeorgica]NEW30413.1 ATP-dependent helicase [Nocardia cyriacigeorgica]